MTVSLWRAFLFLSAVRQSIVTGVNRILGMYCKGAVHKKDYKILAGNLAHSLSLYTTYPTYTVLGIVHLQKEASPEDVKANSELDPTTSNLECLHRFEIENQSPKSGQSLMRWDGFD